MVGYVTIVEPSKETFTDALFTLLEQLCSDASGDVRSPRYLFSYARAAIVEPAMRLLIGSHGRAEWFEGDSRIRISSGEMILAGPISSAGWPLERSVVVCSGSHPDDRYLKQLDGKSLVLVFDPEDPPKRAQELRMLAHGFGV